jgi:hypothetical protein
LAQSNSIEKVIKELSLDYASGNYLNVISSNYGLNRPLFGFSDDLWRAITKVLALQYKQIYTKFIDVLRLVLGPQKTVVTTIVTTAPIGSKILYVNDASNLPQIGILVLDKALASEETISYRFVDYSRNVIYLSSPTTFQHVSCLQDCEETVLFAPIGSLLISCSNTELFPPVPFTLVLGKGTTSEEVHRINYNDVDNRFLLTNAVISNDHGDSLRTNLEYTTLSRPYATSSFFITVSDLEKLPENGVVLLGESSNTLTVSSAPDSLTITVPASSFRAGAIAGFRLVFTGNITPGLAGYEATIWYNLTDTIGFSDILPIVPAVGDTFTLRPVLVYTGKSKENDSINLKYPIPSGFSFPSGTKLEVLKGKEVAAAGQVSVFGVDWDVIQNTHNLVEILLPQSEFILQNLRTASYLHSGQLTASTTVSVSSLIDDDYLTVTSTTAFTSIQSGLLIIDSGGPNEEVVAFTVSTGTSFHVPHKLTIAHLAGESVSYFQTYYSPTFAGATPVAIGDFFVEPDSFPGPYVYDEVERSQSYLSRTTLSQNLAAPTKLSLDVLAGPGPRVLEVEDASLHPQPGTYSAFIDTENFTVTNVYLKSKSRSTTTALSNIGDSTITVTAPVSTKFPVASGYRVILDRGTATAEIAYVISVNSGLNILSFDNSLIYAHTSGATVELVRDCLVVSQIDNNYAGIVSYINRVPVSSTSFPEAEIPVYDYVNGKSVSIRYSTITVNSGTNFPLDGGKLLLSYGSTRYTMRSKMTVASAVGATSVTTDTSLSQFPTVYPYCVEIDYFNLNKEIFSITNNTAGVLTFGAGFAANHVHNIGASITYIGGDYELIDYSSRSGNVLTLSSPYVVQYNHQIGEKAALSLSATPPNTGFGYPFRIPVDYFQRIKYLADLIRAAGIQVVLINKR